jgi:amino acid transporter
MPESPQTRVPTVRRAGLFHLVFLTYSVICSGAYGLEEMIPSSGPGLAILMMVLLPIVWSVPICLVCAELASRHPVEGGYYRWARMAFGDFAGYQTGWLVGLANLATNATFAVLFANYLGYFLPGLGAGARWAAALVLIWGATLLNLLGIRLVGATSVVLTAIIFLPFLFMAIGGLLQWQHNPVTPFLPPGSGLAASLGQGLMIALWLYSGYEKLTPNAGEVENASRAFPIALAITLPMVVASYMVPTVVGLAAADDWSGWGEAHFAVLAEQIGGRWLGSLMAFGGLVSNVSIIMVTTLGQSRLPMVMAEDGLFPRAFGRVGRRFGAPVVSLVAGGIALSLLSRISFLELAGLFSLVQVLAYVLIFASLLRLRARPADPQTAGGRRDTAGTESTVPFTIPLGMAGLVAIMTPGCLIATWVVVQRFWNGGSFDGRRALLDLAVFASGPVTYLLFRRRRGGTIPRVMIPGRGV